MKSYIKLYGPSVSEGLKAMRKLAEELPMLSKGAISEKTLYGSEELVGEYDFAFIWKEKPSHKDLNTLITQLDEFLGETNCRYSIVTME
jgi:hypothetical protein